MKGVLNQSVDGSKLIMKRCGVCSCDSYDAKFNETSKGIFRCTSRELTKRLRQTYQKGQGTLRGTCEDTHPKNEKEA